MTERAPWTKIMTEINNVTLAFDAPIARETTFRVGGRVACLARPKTCRALLDVLDAARNLDRPHVVMGGGSNVLMPDGNWDALVIQLKGFAIGARAKAEAGGTVRLDLGAGVTLAACHRFCLVNGLFGLETLVGIPGTIGGALVMNAGAHGGSISDHLVSLNLVMREGEKQRLERHQLQPGYRSMGLPPESTVLGACFELRTGSKGELRARMRELMARRKATQPLAWPSAGCIFKNPPGASAGMLIDQAGLKGMRIGDAEISEQHANWIINRGKATARDVLTLIERMEQRIDAQFNIQLERELVVFESA